MSSVVNRRHEPQAESQEREIAARYNQELLDQIF